MITADDIALLMTIAHYNTVMPDEREAVRKLRDKLDELLYPRYDDDPDDYDPDDDDEAEDDEYYYYDDDDDQ